MHSEHASIFLRDSTWAAVTALDVNVSGRQAVRIHHEAPLNRELARRSFIGPMEAQWIFATAPMILISTGETIAHKMKGEELTCADVARIWAPSVAASLAIPMWDTAEVIGKYIGENVSFFQNSTFWFGASIATEMIAAPFVGMFEGFTQWSIRYLAVIATNPVKREMWRQDSALMGKLLVKELTLNITIGATPGAVSLIVFFFIFPALMAALGPVGGIILTAVLVALSVMLCSFGSTHLINRISTQIDKEMGWDKRFELIKKSAEKALEGTRKVHDHQSIELQPLNKKRISH